MAIMRRWFVDGETVEARTPAEARRKAGKPSARVTRPLPPSTPLTASQEPPEPPQEALVLVEEPEPYSESGE
jgi:hypothetical protein